MGITDEDFEQANQRGALTRSNYPAAVSVRFDPHLDRLVIELASGIGITFAPNDVQGLRDAKPEEMDDAQISPSGLGVYFPKLDVDLYVPGLLEGYLGTKRWMAAQNGSAGGKVSTEAKAAAARENGKLGGRPKKTPE
jgi:hypothetical protein